MQLPHLKIYNKQDILSVTRIRRFETKIGERIQVLQHAPDLETAIRQSSAPFVLIGIPEDIGVLANQGVGGCDSAWIAFLQAFLNTQSNDFFEGFAIYASPAIRWVVAPTAFKFQFEDGQVFVEIPDAKLMCFYYTDSIVIRQTSGIWYPTELRWQG
ncbi:MAG: hypothetical protein ACK4S0_06060, partial [Sediminibacterium sp.]